MQLEERGALTMPYTLQPLLRIRVMREDRATGELTAARQALSAAEEALEARKRELADYEATKEERRDRIYATVIGRTVSRDQLDMVSEGVARIDEEGVLKADTVTRAEAERKTL
ncbi:MAG: YscO family type III secretion system apparatus protein, partial [Kiritimatiellae bacterium]|nr:YscO family type III secretion system apparatus protein [Kiritimatiellia bacterium]